LHLTYFPIKNQRKLVWLIPTIN